MPFQRSDPCPIEQSKRVHEVRKAGANPKNNQAIALELRALGATFPREELIPSQDVVSSDVVIVSQVEAAESTKFPASSALNTKIEPKTPSKLETASPSSESKMSNPPGVPSDFLCSTLTLNTLISQHLLCPLCEKSGLCEITSAKKAILSFDFVVTCRSYGVVVDL